jgi:hypothetical protein
MEREETLGEFTKRKETFNEVAERVERGLSKILGFNTSDWGHNELK